MADGRLTPQLDTRIVDGPLLPAVFRLAYPAILQYLLVGLQGAVTHVMVGHFNGHAANAALGVASQIFLVVLIFVSSVYTGMSLLVARAAGAGDLEAATRFVVQALVASLLAVVGVVVPLGYSATPWLLNVLNTAPDVREQAQPYLRLLFVFGFGNMISFMIGGALRATGDARTPFALAALLISLNIGLDLLLIPGAGPIPPLGTVGAAIGNVTAGAVAAAVGFYLLFSGRRVIHLHRHLDWRPQRAALAALLRTGLPAGMQGLVMALGGVLLVGFVGAADQSAAAQAAYAICATQLFSLVTWPSLGLMAAASVVAGQNIGAERPDRSSTGVAIACGFGAAIAGTVALLFVIIPGHLIALFGVHDADVLALGTQLLRYLSVSSVPFIVGLICMGGLQGAGDTRSPLFIAFVAQIVLPGVFCAVSLYLGTFEPADVWGAIVLAHTSRCALAIWTFHRGRWRTATAWALARV